MKNIVLKISYDGTRYNGWQRQGNTKNTIQEKLETTLSRLLSEDVEIHGSGRTDAGVHAKGQVANFLTESNMSAEDIKDSLNQYLPEDIAILDAWEAKGRFHSRLNAVGKHYQYRILNSSVPNVFEQKYVYRMEEKLDVETMRKAAQYFIGEHDFKSFCGNKHMKKSTVRRIDRLDVIQNGDEIVLDFYGNGFLYFMVRILTGTLIEVGLHRKNVDSIPVILEAKNREEAGFTAPAQGLCLMEVWY